MSYVKLATTNTHSSGECTVTPKAASPKKLLRLFCSSFVPMYRKSARLKAENDNLEVLTITLVCQRQIFSRRALRLRWGNVLLRVVHPSTPAFLTLFRSSDTCTSSPFLSSSKAEICSASRQRNKETKKGKRTSHTCKYKYVHSEGRQRNRCKICCPATAAIAATSFPCV